MNDQEHFDENPVDLEYVSLHNDIELLSPQLAEISSGIRQQDVSNYPIFIAHLEMIEMGKLLFTKEKNLTNWNISMCTLEILVQTGVIAMDKVDEFRKVYKDPDAFYCFLVMKDEPQFIFIKKPRTLEQ